MELLIGPQERFDKVLRSGWNKSPTKALYHDYADMISIARNTHQNGQNDPFVDLERLHWEIVLALEKKGRTDSDRAIIWFSQISRMTREMGKAKSFEIADLGPNRLPEAAIVTPTRNLFNGYHYSKEQFLQFKDRTNNPPDQFGTQIFVKDGDNGTSLVGNSLGIFFLRLTMKAMELNLREGKKVGQFKHARALKISCFDNNQNFTLFFDDEKDRPHTYLKNLWKPKKHGEKKNKNTWLSTNWPNLPYYREGSFDHIDFDKWDKLVTGEVVMAEEEEHLVCLWDNCQNAVYQEALVNHGFWSEAKAFYLDQGIISNTFMNFVVNIRQLWQKNRINYVLGVGSTNWQSNAKNLDQYIDVKQGWSKITHESTDDEKKKMMKKLFGDQVA
jgi:hypothetical protein